MKLLSDHYVMRRQVSMSFFTSFTVYAYLITVACILELIVWAHAGTRMNVWVKDQP